MAARTGGVTSGRLAPEGGFGAEGPAVPGAGDAPGEAVGPEVAAALVEGSSAEAEQPPTANESARTEATTSERWSRMQI